MRHHHVLCPSRQAVRTGCISTTVVILPTTSDLAGSWCNLASMPLAGTYTTTRCHCCSTLCFEVQLLAAKLKHSLQLCLLSVQPPCLNAMHPCEVKLKPSLNVDTTHTREHSVNSISTCTATQDWACQLDQHSSVTADQVWSAWLELTDAVHDIKHSNQTWTYALCAICFVCCTYMAQCVGVSETVTIGCP